MKIYLAASFAFAEQDIAEERKQIITEAALILRNRGYDVFVPHEHKIPHGETMSNYVWGCAVQQMDKKALHEADWVVVLTFGKTGNNAGVAWEAGYAYGLKKHVLIVKMNDTVESMMMWFSCDAHVKGLAALDRFNFGDPECWDYHTDIEVS